MGRVMRYSRDYHIPLWLIGGHVVLGYLSALIPIVAMLWYHGVLVYAVYNIVTSKNQNNQAAVWASYFVGLEVLMRMCHGLIFWESSKYLSFILLFIGIAVERYRNRSNKWWIYTIILLSIPAVLQTFGFAENPRKAILFNYSGMIALLGSAYYFYKRPIGYDQLKRILAAYLLPMIALAFVLFIRTPELEDITFTSSANFEMSGGFGPNQVATVLGLGYLVIVFYLIYKDKTSSSLPVDIALLFFLIYRSLFTFSRGGNLAIIIALILFIMVHLVWLNKARLINYKSVVAVVLFGALVFGAYDVINQKTDGIFYNRVSGRNTKGVEKEDITSNRLDIIGQELEIFERHPLGVGLGGSRYYREVYYRENVASHNEFGRLLSEHGIFGIFIMAILLGVPMAHFFRVNIHTKGILVLLLSIVISTMMHSAMRISLPGFLYGLSLIVLLPKPNKNDLIYRKQTR